MIDPIFFTLSTILRLLEVAPGASPPLPLCPPLVTPLDLDYFNVIDSGI